MEGLAEVEAHPAFVRAGWWKKPGDVVTATTWSADRAGYVIVAPPTPTGRDATLDYVRRTLVFHTNPA